VLAVAFLLQRFVGEIDPRYRESAEDTLVESVNRIASVVQTHLRDGAIEVEPLCPVFRDLYGRTLNARIYTVDEARGEARARVRRARVGALRLRRAARGRQLFGVARRRAHAGRPLRRAHHGGSARPARDRTRAARARASGSRSCGRSRNCTTVK
jgi:hypothetical protein